MLPRSWGMMMLGLAVAAAQPVDAAREVELCRPLLARKIGGDIDAIEAQSTRRAGKTTTINGELTAFLGMGSPPAGSASTHHLIRAEFTFTCRLDRGKVRAAHVKPTH